MKKALIIIFPIILFINALPTAAENEDILGKILHEVGFTRQDLGYMPKGYWNRFPLDIPHRLTSFDALFAEPLKLYDYATVMANTVELYLDPTYADTAADGLYKLVYNLGVDKKRGGFRSYSANLLPPPTGKKPVEEALTRLYSLADKQITYFTFGSRSDLPEVQQAMEEQISKLPDTVQTILAGLIIHLTEAIEWRNRAFRRCNMEDMQKAFAIRDLANTQSDGTIYYPELDDIAATIDWASLHYAALKVAAAAEQAEKALLPHIDDIPSDFGVEIPTPFGKIAMFAPARKGSNPPPLELPSVLPSSRSGWLEYDADNSLLILDFGQNIIYQGTAGATASLMNPISVVIDLGGDDFYGYQRRHYPPTSGVGLLGVGLVLDHAGNDSYNGSTYAQGAGLFGVGILLDREGNDRYTAELSAQGCGYFGIGLCFDGTGDDEYYLYGDGQGMGGIGSGIGVCASFEGNDKYTAEPYVDVYDRGDYHSKHKINGNQAQGAGFGRRGDGSDGHAWAGGLGAIIDIYGDDLYYSGNWSLGTAYWFSTGIAVDRYGDDTYRSCYFTQGSGAHYCNGILLDEEGNDTHELYETAGAGLGFGWDFTNAFLIDKGGDDTYRAKIISMGLAQIRSNAFLIDIGGNDNYYLGKGTPGLGEASYRKGYLQPRLLTVYLSYAKSFGGFIDIGGNDGYFAFSEDETTTHPVAQNNHLWLQPARSDSLFGADNYGVGIDIEEGTIPEFSRWDYFIRKK